MFTLKERTCISRDGSRIIKEGKEDGYLLGPEGHQIPEEQAVALGLMEEKAALAANEDRFKKKIDAAKEKVGGKKAEDKAGKKPANKGKEPAGDKAGDAAKEKVGE